MSSLEEVKEKAKKVRDTTREQTMGFITAALSLVAGLAWNDAITSMIKEVFPGGASNLLAKFVYALTVTVVVVALSLLVRKILTIQAEEKK
jgi:formate/nitrite transporter FocA (FNT family)